MFKRLAVPLAATMFAASIAVPQAVASEKCSIEVVGGTLSWGLSIPGGVISKGLSQEANGKPQARSPKKERIKAVPILLSRSMWTLTLLR